jgi:hypothetical protein
MTRLQQAQLPLMFTWTVVARKALREVPHRFAASGLDPRRHPGVLAAMPSTPQPATQIPLTRSTVQDQSRRRPSQVLSTELVQKLLEGLSPCPTRGRHGRKIGRRLLYRALSSGTINLPLPRLRYFQLTHASPTASLCPACSHPQTKAHPAAQPRAPPVSPLPKSVSRPPSNLHAPRLQFPCAPPPPICKSSALFAR